MENVTIHIISHKIGDSNRSNIVAYLVCLGATVKINVSWYILKYLRNGWMDFFFACIQIWSGINVTRIIWTLSLKKKKSEKDYVTLARRSL